MATHVKTKSKYSRKNLLANFRLHHFKSVGCRKLANIWKSIQICKPSVQKITTFVFFLIFVVNDFTTTCTSKVFNSNFWYYLTQPNPQPWLQGICFIIVSGWACRLARWWGGQPCEGFTYAYFTTRWYVLYCTSVSLPSCQLKMTSRPTLWRVHTYILLI